MELLSCRVVQVDSVTICDETSLQTGPADSRLQVETEGTGAPGRGDLALP